ncbi:MAG: hypothetical protein M3Q23_14860 [Actinomycetota bacterium]|nr:hypothetical protein [Actinomycetota bacterium]
MSRGGTGFSWRPRPDDGEAPWSAALFRGEIAFVVVALVGEVLAFAQDLFGNLPFSTATVARIGGVYFFAFHHVPVAFEATRSQVHGPFLEASVAMLTVTGLAAFLLFRGGRAVGDRAGGGTVRRSLWGAAVAVPYAGLALFLSYVVTVHVPLPLALEGGTLRISVSHLWAFVWPFGIAAVAGAAGGLWSARPGTARRSAEPSWGGRAVAALGGGWRMFLYALGLSLAGLLILGAAHPDAARAYASGTVGGGARGLDALVHHVLVLPNQSVWVSAPALGACDGVYGGTTSVDLLCYGRVPRDVFFSRLVSCPGGRPWECVRFGSAPPGLLAFLLVPLGASVLAGLAIGSRAAGAADAAARGALAGVVFAALMAVASVLGGLSITVRSETGPPATTMVGPRLGPTVLLALGWGIGGGVAGALMARRRARQGSMAAAPTGTPGVSTS